MTPIKPYLLRTVRDWALDNGLTPHIVVDARVSGVQVPERFVENDRIVLNIHPRAVQNYAQDDERLSFSARFGGVAHLVEVPMAAVLAVYARENGQGVSFPATPDAPAGPDTEPPVAGSPPRGGRPQLKVVK